MINTKCLYDDYHPVLALRVLITRYWPRGKTWSELGIDRHFSDLAPSTKLLKKQKEIDFRYFLELFRTEMKNNPKARRALRLIDKLDDRFDIDLLCYEKEGDQCHRYTVRDILKNERWWKTDD